MARYRPDAFPCCRPWQDCAPMRSRRGLGREKHQFAATYRRHVFRYSLFWQDMRAMCPKSPAECRWGIRRANILPPRGVFAVRSPQIMHGAQILPPSDGLGPCAGVPTPQRLADTRHLPIPVTCQYPPLAAPIAARDKPPMNFGGDHSAHGLQFGQASRDCRLHHLGVRPITECCAELGLNSKTVNKWAQNLRRRPQARPGLRQRCQKRPSKGRIPLDGTIGAPSGTPMPHTLPLRKNEAAKPGKNFAKRVIFTPQTRFRRLSGEICSKRVPRLLLSARFEYVSQSSWHRPANSAYVWAKSRPIGAETPFEKQKCTRMSKSEGMWHSSAPSNAACLATAGKTNL